MASTLEKIIEVWPESVSVTFQQASGCVNWCTDNFGPDGEKAGTIYPERRWAYYYFSIFNVDWNNRFRYLFCFKTKADAVMFKLGCL